MSNVVELRPDPELAAIVASIPMVVQAISEGDRITVVFGGSVPCIDLKTRTMYLPAYAQFSAEQLSLESARDVAMALRDLYLGITHHECSHGQWTDMTGAKHAKVGLHFRRALEDIRIDTKRQNEYRGVRRIYNDAYGRLIRMGYWSDPEPDATPLSLFCAWLLFRGRADICGQAVFDALADGVSARLVDVCGKEFVDGAWEIISRVRSAQTTADVDSIVVDLLEYLKAPPEEDPQTPEVGNEGQSSSDGQPSDASQSGSSGQCDPSSDGEQSSSGSSSSDSSGDDDTGGDGSSAGDGDAETDAGGASSSAAGSQAGAGDSTGCYEGAVPEGAASDAPGQSGSAEGSTSQASPSSGVASSRYQSGSGSQDAQSSSGGDSSTSGACSKPDVVPAGAGDGSGRRTYPSLDEDPDLPADLDGALAEALGEVTQAALRAGATPVVPASAVLASPDGSAYAGDDDTRPLSVRLSRLLETKSRCYKEYARRGGRLDSQRLSRLPLGERELFVTETHVQRVDTAAMFLLDRSLSMRHDGRMLIARAATLRLALALSDVKGMSVSACAFPWTVGHDERHLLELLPFGKPVRRYARSFLGCSAGGSCTPLAPALDYCRHRLLRRPEPRKQLYVVTDGQPDCRGEQCVPIIEQMSREGIEVMGVGIGVMVVKELFPAYRVVTNLSLLEQAMFSLLNESLARKAA